MLDLPIHRFSGRDGADLVYRELGEGRPVVLVHGYFSTATVNWLRYGHAEAIAARGFRVIMPDLRAHGDSAAPHDPAAYPPDVMADDGLALVEHLGLTEYDLGGYSLGGRTVARMVLRGASPGRAVIAGMGLDGIVHATDRGGFYHRVLTNLGSFPRGTEEWRAEAFLRTVGGDPVALLHVLDSVVNTDSADLRRIEIPTLVLIGAKDEDHASAKELASLLPDGRYLEMPGTHMSAVTKPDLGRAIADFLSAEPPR
jgi:pimeloyl-ACP methyl ester carboxylesterase